MRCNKAVNIKYKDLPDLPSRHTKCHCGHYNNNMKWGVTEIV